MNIGLAYIERHNFDNSAAAAEKAALRIATELRLAVHERGRAVLAVGLSADALPLLKILVEADIPWNFITVSLTNECCVPLKDARSRETVLREILQSGRAVEAHFVGLYNAARTTELAAFSACGRVDRLNRPFDCVVLDMDLQGQTAGFFKSSSRLKTALTPMSRALVLANYVKTSGETYLTMTLPLLLSARLLILPLRGKQKLLVLEEVLGHGAEEDMPIRSVLRYSKSKVKVFWSP